MRDVAQGWLDEQGLAEVLYALHATPAD